MEANEEPGSTASVESNENQERADDLGEPPAKKLRPKPNYPTKESAIEEGESSTVNEKLEKRLFTVLCCNVCLDLPLNAIFQCPNGHLMCAGCFNHLLADGRLRNEMPTCPNCRIEITESSCMRNLAVEKAVSELPILCKFCKCNVPRCQVAKHENDKCLERMVSCKYYKIGCHWQGVFSKKLDHEERCAQARKNGIEIVESLDQMYKEEENKLNLYKSIMSLFSSQRILVHDLQLRPRRTDDFIPELYYDTNRFSAFGQDWVIRAQVVGNEKSLRRGFTFQLVQVTKSNIFFKYIFVKSPFADIEIHPVIFQHEFSLDSQESCEEELPISQDIDINKVLAGRLIPLRIVMFQPKTSI